MRYKFLFAHTEVHSAINKFQHKHFIGVTSSTRQLIFFKPLRKTGELQKSVKVVFDCLTIQNSNMKSFGRVQIYIVNLEYIEYIYRIQNISINAFWLSGNSVTLDCLTKLTRPS